MSFECASSFSPSTGTRAASGENHIAIRVDNLSKGYHLYDKPRDRLKQFLLPRLYHLMGRPGSQYFREFWALKDLSFEVKKGETVGIVGRNGSGKSTLLQLICGTLSPTIGNVETHGRIAALLELGSGFNPEFSGRENVYLNAAVLGLTKHEIEERFEDIAAFADIGQFIEQPVKTYSSGMYVRLAFAVAIHVEPQVLIVDEALSVGDFAFQTKCVRQLRSFLDGGGTLLFVSHDITTIKSLCQKAIYLRQGRLQKFGIASQVCDFYLAEVQREEGLAQTTQTLAPPQAKHAIPSLSHGAIETFRKAVLPFRRHSSLECEFVSVELLGANGEVIHTAAWGQEIIVRITLLAHVLIEELIVAFYIQDKLQNSVMGTNTVYEGKKISPVRAGEVVRIDFAYTNMLRAGEYAVCVIAADRPINTVKYFDWIDLAASYRSLDRPGQITWAVFTPRIKVQVHKSDGAID